MLLRFETLVFLQCTFFSSSSSFDNRHSAVEWLSQALSDKGFDASKQRARQQAAPAFTDEILLKDRIRELELLSKEEGAPWPFDSIEHSAGINSTWWSVEPAKRCAHLTSRKRTVRKMEPIALMLTGQLRTAELTLPFLEENVVRASAPRAVHLFAHLWSLGSAEEGAAGARALARLRRVQGLKEVMVDPEDQWEAITRDFYAARYGRTWIDNMKNLDNFLGQWMKVSG